MEDYKELKVRHLFEYDDDHGVSTMGNKLVVLAENFTYKITFDELRKIMDEQTGPHQSL